MGQTKLVVEPGEHAGQKTTTPPRDMLVEARLRREDSSAVGNTRCACNGYHKPPRRGPALARCPCAGKRQCVAARDARVGTRARERNVRIRRGRRRSPIAIATNDQRRDIPSYGCGTHPPWASQPSRCRTLLPPPRPAAYLWRTRCQRSHRRSASTCAARSSSSIPIETVRRALQGERTCSAGTPCMHAPSGELDGGSAWDGSGGPRSPAAATAELAC